MAGPQGEKCELEEAKKEDESDGAQHWKVQDSSEGRKAAFCKWDKKEILVIQRGAAQRKEEEEERAQGERRKEQWESIRELSSERQREAEEF